MTNAATPDITIAAFENGDIDADRFDHVAHLYTAWLYLEAFPENADERFVQALKRLTLKLGVPGKYHDTITRFYLALLFERRRLTSGGDWPAFQRANGDLFDKSANVLSRYYSSARLSSDAARRRFLLPDKLPTADTEAAADRA